MSRLERTTLPTRQAEQISSLPTRLFLPFPHISFHMPGRDSAGSHLGGMDPPRHTLSPIHGTFEQASASASAAAAATLPDDREYEYDRERDRDRLPHMHPSYPYTQGRPASSASSGPSRSPNASFSLPPLHSITQSYPPSLYGSSASARRPSPVPHLSPQASTANSPGAGPSSAIPDADTPSGSTSGKKRKRPTKADALATAESLGIRQTQRVPLSCRECSRRKIRCDKAIPCKPCVERGEEATCQREAVMVKGKIVTNEPAPTVTMESLAQENAEIKKRIERLERMIGHSPSPLKNEEALEFKEHRLAGVMEEVALGIGENVRWKGVSMSSKPESTSSKDQWYHSVPFDTCLSTIPNRIKSECLVTFFADELSWIDGVVHVPTFVRQHNTFWLKSDQGRVDDDNWLALYFAVLSLTGYFMESDHAQLNGFQPTELSRLAKVWFDCSIAILMRNNFLGAPAFVALQAVQVLRYPFHLSGNTAIHNSIHILGQRHAMAMNLHLVGDGYGETQEERLAREMARRVWWGFVEPDWAFLPYLRYCREYLYTATGVIQLLASTDLTHKRADM